MNQQEKLKAAKDLCVERVKGGASLDEDFDQIGFYDYASLEQVDGEEIWVVLSFKAKKKFDIDEALEEFEFQKKQELARQEKKNRGKKKESA